MSCNLPEIIKSDIDAVILTHEHIDHVYGLPSLIHQMWLSGRKRKLKIYVPAQMLPFANAFIDLFQLKYKKSIFEIEFSTETEFLVGTIHVSIFCTNHTEMSIGVVAVDGSSTLVYTSDTRPIQVLPLHAEEADVLIHEASGVAEREEELIKKGHSSGLDAGKLAKRLKVKELYLCHLPIQQIVQEQVLEEALTIFEKAKIPEILRTYLS